MEGPRGLAKGPRPDQPIRSEGTRGNADERDQEAEARPRVWDERSDVGQPDHQNLPHGAPGDESDPDPERLVHHDRNTHRYVSSVASRRGSGSPGRRSSPRKFTPRTRATYANITICHIMCYGDTTSIDMGLETAGVWRACVSCAAARRVSRPRSATAAPPPQASSSGSAGCSPGGDASRPRGHPCPRRDGRG